MPSISIVFMVHVDTYTCIALFSVVCKSVNLSSALFMAYEQGECWFQLRQSALSQTAETAGLNPFGILKERLRTLEETASLMARAVVNKGNMTSINRHPDYEFFLSRRQ